MGILYFFWKFIVIEFDVAKFLSFIFPISFWIYGNIAGMWYIDVILIFYFVFPFLYYCLESGRSKLYVAILMILGILVNIFLYSFDSTYYELTAIGISKIPLLILGSYVGKCAYEEKKIRWKSLFCISIIWLVAYILVSKDFIGYTWLCDIRSILGCFYVAIMIDLFKNRYLNATLAFFGTITLELYLLHLFIGDVLFTYHIYENDAVRYCLTIILSVIAAHFFSGGYRKILRN